MSKRSRIKELDDLPLELIHSIQLLLPSFKEAASTCILSKSWLRAWNTLPTLKLTPHVLDAFENKTKCSKLIHTTLQRYHRENIPMESFHLHMNIRKNNVNMNLEDVKNWIRLVVSKSSLKDLSLRIDFFIDESLALPNELFSSQNLRTINVTSAVHNRYIPFRISTNNPFVINCVSLRVLELNRVVITDNVFCNLMSTCTLLEKIKVLWCEGLENAKIKNLVRLSDLEITSIEAHDLWEIDNVPSLCSFHYRSVFSYTKLLPFKIDSLASVTQLCIEGVVLDDSFFNTVESKFCVLESLTLGIRFWELENMVISCVSLKWLTLEIFQGWQVNVQVNAPRLLSFIYTGGNILPGLLFQTTAPEKVKLTLDACERFGLRHLYFLRMREALNISSKFDINIRSANLDSVMDMNIDVDDLRRRVSFPVENVDQLTLFSSLDERAWKQSRFFDALFLICHPSYISSSYQVIRKMMEGNRPHLKQVLFKNPHNKKWEALTSSRITALQTFRRMLECKLYWFPQ